MNRVLVVDDEPQIVRALSINLRARRYEVFTAASGAEALKVAAAHPPDLVILDLGLPDMDGTEVIGGLRGWTNVPILVLSGPSDSADKVDALDAGADDYVIKPFGMDELLARMRAMARRGAPGTTDEPVPRIFPVKPFQVGSLRFDTEQVGVVLAIVVVAGLLYLLLRRTFLGTCIRAVVDRRELAELMTVDANRVSAVSWALGTFLAGLAGVLLAPRLLLDPSTLLLVVLGSYACAVGGKLSSLPLTYGTAVGLSVLDSLTTRFFPDNGFFGAARPQYFFIAFLVLALTRLGDVGEVAGGMVRRGPRRAPWRELIPEFRTRSRCV